MQDCIFGRGIPAEAIALGQQVMLMATHLEKKWDWRAFAAASVFGAVSTGANSKSWSSVGVTNAIDTLGNDVIYGQRLDGKDIAAISTGSMVGAYVGQQARETYDAQQKANKKMVGKINKSNTDKQPLPNKNKKIIPGYPTSCWGLARSSCFVTNCH